jgi:hypothetical protein
MTAVPFEQLPDVQVIALDEESFFEHKQQYIDDPWPFAVGICGFDRLVERFHRPLIYLYAGKPYLLLELLREGRLHSEVTDQIRQQLRDRGLDPHNFDHEDRICKFLRETHNIRISRGTGKTSCEVAAITYVITIDPNEHVALVGYTDDTAGEIGGKIAKIVKSDRYKEWFPERIPDNERTNLSIHYVKLAGRTRGEITEPNVMALGHGSNWTSFHFSRIFYDDVICYENSAPTEMRASLKIMANFDGLRQPYIIWPAGVQESHTGTIWSRFDDNSVLEKNDECLTIKIPIHRRKDGQPWTLKNYQEKDAGVPCLPEWYNEEQIAEKMRSTLRRSLEEGGGRTAWFCNYLLIPQEDEVLPFHPDVVDKAKFEWRVNQRTQRLEVCRPATTINREPLYDTAGKRLYFCFDPHRMRRVAAVDQAYSKKSGADQWAIAVVSIDHQGFRYVLYVVVGHGYNEMLDAIRECDELWEPETWLMESNGAQSATLAWMRMDKGWQFLAARLEGVEHWGSASSKPKRIREDVAAPMETGELLLNPEDFHTPTEAKQYNPQDRDPADAALDAIAMASVRLVPTEYRTSEEEAADEARARVSARAQRDQETGIDIVNWWDVGRNRIDPEDVPVAMPRSRKPWENVA